MFTGEYPGPQCAHEYCWVCLADFNQIRLQGNGSHDINCQYHSNNIPGAPGHEAWLAAQDAVQEAPPAIPDDEVLTDDEEFVDEENFAEDDEFADEDEYPDYEGYSDDDMSVDDSE